MKCVGQIRVFSCAIILAIWAAAYSLGVTSKLSIAFFLLAVAAAATIAELERKRQRDALKKELRDGHRS